MSTPGDVAATFCATLVDEWVRHGIRDAVVAPGSRSTPLALALVASSEITTHVFHDERSASFAALGFGLASGIPAILLCTSGTAAAHFHAAVIEAHQSNVPMIVCTADRPPELRDVGAPQTIDQTNLYGSAVRWFHDPGVPSDDARDTWRSLASRAYSLSLTFRPGPVHLNLPFRDPLLGTVGELPAPRDHQWNSVIHESDIPEDFIHDIANRISGRRGVIVAGKGSSPAVLDLARALHWPVFADPRSGLRECAPEIIVAFDPILRSSRFAEHHFPEFVVRFGEPPASKVLAQWVTRTKATVVQVNPHQVVTDPDHIVASTVVGDVSRFCTMLATLSKATDVQWSTAWQQAENAAQEAISAWARDTFSEPSVVRTVTDTLQPNSHFVVSSSMPIRDVEWFGTVTPGVQVHSNRGANGIDGVVSTAVGVAVSTRQPTTLLIGDVAFLHDVNGLIGLKDRNADLSIVVTNNDGGSIFSFLPQGSQVEVSVFEKIYGTPHGVSIKDLASAYGIAYHAPRTLAEVSETLSASGTKIIEIVCDRSVNVAQHDAVNQCVIEAVESTVS